MKLPPFEYRAPATVGEAIEILADQDGAAKVIAGGQSLIPLFAFRLASPSVLVDLSGIAGLDEIAIGANRAFRSAPWCDGASSRSIPACAAPVL